MTETQPVKTNYDVYKGALRPLSEVLEDVPPGELFLVLERFESAVMDGKIASLPEAGRSFTRDVIQPGGQRKKIRIQDEALIYNDGVAGWIAEQRRETRYLLLQHSDAKITTTRDRLMSGTDDFKRLLEIRRERIKAREKEAAAQRRGKKVGPLQEQ